MSAPPPPPRLDALAERPEGRDRIERLAFEGIVYWRAADDLRGLPRGTVQLGDRLIVGYPRIGRILSLREGLPRQIAPPFVAEEKVDGYNVRVVVHEGRPLAFTRGGFLCPFTTDRLEDLLPLEVFRAEPELVVCAEVAGPGSPYTPGGPPEAGDDVAAFVFDLARVGEPGFLDVDARRAIAERFALPAVRELGRFERCEVERALRIARELDREGREGIVFKELRGDGRRVKYVTAAADLADLAQTMGILRDLPPEYFLDRIVRLVFFLADQGRPVGPELEGRLGRALLAGWREAIEEHRRHGHVARRFRCRLRRREAAEALLELLARGGAKPRLLALEPEGSGWRLEFERVYPRTSGWLAHLASGGLVFD